MTGILPYAWLIALPPLLGAAMVHFFRRQLRGRDLFAGVFCSATLVTSFAIAAACTAAIAKLPARRMELIVAPWFSGLPMGRGPAFQADWGILLDPLSCVMILIITGIGALIHVYSIGYMRHEEGTPRFFGYMNLFVFFMLILVLANNYLMLFVGWEGVGLCSYLLIGFHFERPAANLASMKAFLTNRLGDIGLLLGILMLWRMTGTVQYTQINPAVLQGQMWLGMMALLLGFGAAGKSAQFPLFTWLPDAMEGPTPVSALIHAATMVTAGVYLIARSASIYALTAEVSTVIGIVGAFTAILAASIAIVQHDIKRVLAYSTVSQLGYMFMALGSGAYWVAIFHLFTHAFFKALLFLGAGSIIHALDGEQDLRNMGGLRKKLPITHATMLVAALAISGFPGLAGFFSKDEILWRVFNSPLGFKSIYIVGLVTSYLTAFYMWRLMARVFYGAAHNPHTNEVHESPASMTIPLLMLAAGTAAAGWLGVPPTFNLVSETFQLFERWLRPVFPMEAPHAEGSVGLSAVLMLVSVSLGVIAFIKAWQYYVRRPQPPMGIGWLYKALVAQWFLDRLYQAVLVESLAKGLGRVLARFDDAIVDGAVRGTAAGTMATSRGSVEVDTLVVDGAVRSATVAGEGASYGARMLQTGVVSSYAWILLSGLTAVLLWVVLR